MGQGSEKSRTGRHARITDRWAQGYGVEVREDGAFGKDGGDPGVEALARYLPWSDTTVVVLANLEGVVDHLGESVIGAAEAP